MQGARHASLAARNEPTWFGHPRGLTVLFLTEMWEKFSFFGMRVLLVYYMTKSLAFDQGKASLVYGLYTAFIYLTPVLGGWIADRHLTRRRAVLLGGAIMAAGHFMMAVPALFYPALATIAVGNGLFLPTLPSQIGSLYAPADPRATFAYSYYYVGVNLGAFLAPIVCGTLGEVYGWHWGFGAAGVGMVTGLLIYVAGRPYLPPDPRECAERLPLPRLDAEGRSRFAFLLVVAAIAMVFRSAYEQVGNTVALWADSGVDRSLGPWTLPVTWYMSINPLIVFLGTPILVGFWSRRARRTGRETPPLRRMAAGALIVAAAYLLAAGSDAWTSAPSGWPLLLAFMVLFTLGELWILPVGLALFGRMAPKGFEATTLALWFLAAFAGNLAAGVLGTLWSVLSHPQFFVCVAAIASAAGAALLVLGSFDRALAVQRIVPASGEPSR